MFYPLIKGLLTMPDNTQHLTVVGTDGIVPVHEPNALWKTWLYSEIFFGKNNSPGKGK